MGVDVSEIKKPLASRIFRKSKMSLMSCEALCRLKQTAPPCGDILKINLWTSWSSHPNSKTCAHQLIRLLHKRPKYQSKKPKAPFRWDSCLSGALVWPQEASSPPSLWRWTFCSFLTFCYFKVRFSLHLFSFQKRNAAKEFKFLWLI